MAQGWEGTSRLTEAFSALVGNISQIVWLSEEGGLWTWANPSWEAYTGLNDDMSRGRGWIGAIPTNERGWAMEAWQNAPSKGCSIWSMG